MKNIKMILLVFLLLTVSGCVENEENVDDNNDQTWLGSYVPVHSVGEDSDEFWVHFPRSNESSGESITHLSWIEDSLSENCVVFVVHKTGCVGCTDQAERVISIAGEYEDNVKFWDLDFPIGGEIQQMAFDSYLYDPDGPPGYIALTGIFTYVEQSGEIKIGWHSWEAPNDMNVSDAELESWIRDAIYYHYVNSGEK